MNSGQFDAWVRGLAGLASRRVAVRALAGGALGAGLGLLGWGRVAAACRTPGKKCTHYSQCCSGVCKGKKGKKKCRAVPGQCSLERDACFFGPEEAICDTNRSGTCACFNRVNNTAFCAGAFAGGCHDCNDDTDCFRAFGPGGFVCVVCSGLGMSCPTLTACVPPCPNPA